MRDSDLRSAAEAAFPGDTAEDGAARWGYETGYRAALASPVLEHPQDEDAHVRRELHEDSKRIAAGAPVCLDCGHSHQCWHAGGRDLETEAAICCQCDALHSFAHMTHPPRFAQPVSPAPLLAPDERRDEGLILEPSPYA